MTAQAASQSETVTFQALLSSFLIANRIAVEETCRVGWHYDEDLWEELSEKCQRRDLACKPEQKLAELDENRRAKVKNRQSGHQARASGSSQQMQQHYQQHSKSYPPDARSYQKGSQYGWNSQNSKQNSHSKASKKSW